MKKWFGFVLRRFMIEYYCLKFGKDWSSNVKNSLAKALSPHFRATEYESTLDMEKAVREGVKYGEVAGAEKTYDFVLPEDFWEEYDGKLIINCPFCGDELCLEEEYRDEQKEHADAINEGELDAELDGQVVPASEMCRSCDVRMDTKLDEQIG